ncbi:MAG: hypothetical protein ACYTE8_00450 [Planctomycetota bacterium]|jgi:hypothetical protein
MSRESANLWSWKDSEIQEELERLGIELEEYERKEAINAIKLAYVKGEVRETKDHVKELKESGIDLRKVIFHSQGEQDIPYVFVGHNGRGFYIPKEIEVEVPYYILNSCIKDAVEDRLFPATMQDGSIEWKTRRVQRYPYSYVD